MAVRRKALADEIDRRSWDLTISEAELKLDSFSEMTEAGTAIPSYASHVQTWATEIEARMRMAETELGIIERELHRRAGSR